LQELSSNVYRNTRNVFWVAVFFLLTGGALSLATYQTVRTFAGSSKPDFSAAIGELLLVIVLGAGEVLAFFALRHTAQERENFTAGSKRKKYGQKKNSG
jgi:hypothetical protein